MFLGIDEKYETLSIYKLSQSDILKTLLQIVLVESLAIVNQI